MKIVRSGLTTLFMTLILCILMTVNVMASEVYTYDFFNYTVEGKSVTITGYFGKEEEVTIPSMIVGYPVSKIASGAFKNSKTVGHINLPDTIMEVESGAIKEGITVTYNSNTEEPIHTQAESTASENAGTDTEQNSMAEENDDIEFEGSSTKTDVNSNNKNSSNTSADTFQISEAEVSMDDLMEAEETSTNVNKTSTEENTSTEDKMLQSTENKKSKDTEAEIDENEKGNAEAEKSTKIESADETNSENADEIVAEPSDEANSSKEEVESKEAENVSNYSYYILIGIVVLAIGVLILKKKKK